MEARRSGRIDFVGKREFNDSDWIGKHWARWSAAVRESWLEPNQMQAARDEDELIEKFFDSMRKNRGKPNA
jgi:hypothetical protein